MTDKQVVAKVKKAWKRGAAMERYGLTGLIKEEEKHLLDALESGSFDLEKYLEIQGYHDEVLKTLQAARKRR